MPLRKLHSHGCPHHCRELDLFESMPHEDAGTRFDVVSWYCPECRQVFTFLIPADEAAGYWPDGDLTYWSAGCLRDVQERISRLMAERRERR